MGRYPARPLEERLAWMRERQRRKTAGEPLADPGAGLVMVNLPPRVDPPREETSAERQMLRVKDVAKELSVSAPTVARWFKDRAVIVSAGRRNTTMLISRRTLDEWKREHTRQPA